MPLPLNGMPPAPYTKPHRVRLFPSGGSTGVRAAKEAAQGGEVARTRQSNAVVERAALQMLQPHRIQQLLLPMPLLRMRRRRRRVTTSLTIGGAAKHSRDPFLRRQLRT